jgi:hypothetical protein
MCVAMIPYGSVRRSAQRHNVRDTEQSRFMSLAGNVPCSSAGRALERAERRGRRDTVAY